MSRDRMMERLWTYEDLERRWDLSGRQVRRVAKKLGLKSVDLGNRTKRFRPQAVMAAEEAAESGRKRKSGALWEAK